LRLRAGALRAGAQREQLLEALAPLLLEVAHLPEAPKLSTDRKADLRLAGPQRPVERGADVVPLCVETIEPFALLRAEQSRLGFLGQREVEAGMPAPDCHPVAARRETLERVLTDGLEHPQARLVPAGMLGREQAVAEERLDPVQDVEVGLLGDGLRTAEREASDEHAKTREELSLPGPEQVVAPLDRAAQGPLALGQA
jgi:hypothetical protein